MMVADTAGLAHGQGIDMTTGGLRHAKSPARGLYLTLKRSSTRFLRLEKCRLIEKEVE